jgi:hydrogenase maturation protease
MSRHLAETVVLGIGNVLRSDEGVGVHAVRALEARGLAGADLVDGGTNAYEALAGYDAIERLIVVDAVDAKSEPGAVFRFRESDLEPSRAPVSLHQLGLLDALGWLRACGVRMGEVVVIGVQPAVTDWGLELSNAVAARMDTVLELIEREMRACAVGG